MIDLTRQCALCGSRLRLHEPAFLHMSMLWWCGDADTDDEQNHDDRPELLCGCSGRSKKGSSRNG